MDFIDMHTHILCNVDEIWDEEESIQIIDAAYKAGTRKIICTPHYRHFESTKTPEEITTSFEALKEAVLEKYDDLELFCGQELFYCTKLADLLDEGKVLTLAGSSYVLVEFSPKERFSDIREGLLNLQMRGYIPILAHAERYEEIRDVFLNAEELVNMGILMQVDSDAVLGNTSGAEKVFIKRLLNEDMVSFISSNVHNTKGEKPDMIKCYEAVGKKYGWQKAELLFKRNAQTIIEESNR